MKAQNFLAPLRGAGAHQKLRGFLSQRLACLLATIVLLSLQAESVAAITIYAVDSASNLIRFDSATPGTIVSSQPIMGLISGDLIEGLDFRPVDGTLFALGTGSRLYIIDPA